MSIAIPVTFWLFTAAGVVVAVLSVMALVDCLRRPADNFRAMGKLSKGAWLGMTAAATVVSVLSIVTASGSSLFTLAAAVVAGVYLADVRPAVSGKSGYSW